MKPLVEKLPLAENTSFLAHTFTTPHFEVPWHQHIEYELILFKKGEGASYIGNYIGDFKPGDIFFLGSNLPHTFQKMNKRQLTSALVIQFRPDFWGEDFLKLPEARIISQLFETAAHGLKINEDARQQLAPMMRQLEKAAGFERLILLCNCLLCIATTRDYLRLSTQDLQTLNLRNKERIDKIVQYTIENYQQSISLAAVAKYVSMSVPAFCSYFKKRTKKTFVDFLNEVRIGSACKQLIDTQNKIASICYDSGFNTLANFNKQFLKVKEMTPSAYRRKFMGRELH